MIDVDGRPSFGDLRMSIEPQSAVFGSAKPALLPASDVAVVAARLVGLDESRTVLVEGELELPAQAGEQRFVFPIASLGELDCRRLRSLRLGEYEVVAECEIRTGTRSVTSVERTFPVLAEREWLDPVRRAARERLAQLATTPTGAALTFELADASRYAVRGERLPGVVVVNRSSQPILDLRAFSVAYQIKRPDGLEFVGSGGADGDPCLCPGDSISIESSEALQPCGEAIEGEGGEHGLVILVSSSGLDPRRLGPLPVVAVDASGAQLSPPRMAGREVVVEAACAVDATNLELRLSIEGEGEIVVPFPAIAAGGRASLTLPASLGPETLAIWEGWRGGGRRVEVELLEARLGLRGGRAIAAGLPNGQLRTDRPRSLVDFAGGRVGRFYTPTLRAAFGRRPDPRRTAPCPSRSRPVPSTTSISTPPSTSRTTSEPRIAGS